MSKQQLMPLIYSALGSATIVGSVLIAVLNLYLGQALAAHSEKPHRGTVTDEQYNQVRQQINRVESRLEGQSAINAVIQKQNEKEHKTIDGKLDRILEKLERR